MQSNKKVPLLIRASEIIKEDGIVGFIDAIKRYFFWNPVEREVWYYLNRYLRPSTIVIKKVMGSKMMLDLKDKGLCKDLFLFGCREPECTKIFKEELKDAKMVVWNGPLGIFEIEDFSYGTREIAEFLAKVEAVKVIGGGDTAACIEKMDMVDKFSHISTGGGASLEYLEGKILPGIEALKEI